MSGELGAASQRDNRGLGISEPGQRPRVDGIVLSWERVDDTVAAIESLLAQEGVDLRVVVVDQGSSEACRMKLRAAYGRSPNVTLHELGYNSGAARGRNIAVSLCTAEIIVGLDNDAVLDGTHTLPRVVERFASDPDLGVIAFCILDARTRALDLVNWAHGRRLRKLADREFWSTRFAAGGFACRREVYMACNGFDETIDFAEELDLARRIILCDKKILYYPNTVVLHKFSRENRTEWRGGRYRKWIKNRLHIESRYGSSGRRILLLSGGYLIKGFFNGVPLEALLGLADAMRLINRSRLLGSQAPQLNNSARAYIESYETRFEGGWWTRLRTDTLTRFDE